MAEILPIRRKTLYNQSINLYRYKREERGCWIPAGRSQWTVLVECSLPRTLSWPSRCSGTRLYWVSQPDEARLFCCLICDIGLRLVRQIKIQRLQLQWCLFFRSSWHEISCALHLLMKNKFGMLIKQVISDAWDA